MRGLVDSSVEKEILHLVFQIVSEMPAVEGIHSLRGRYVGEEMHLDIAIAVHPDLKIADSDVITAAVRARIQGELKHARDIRVTALPARAPRHRGPRLNDPIRECGRPARPDPTILQYRESHACRHASGLHSDGCGLGRTARWRRMNRL